MSEEEINEALKIIKEPITVNSIEYKYFNQENYEKLLSVYENAKWFVSNWKQALQELRDTIDNQNEEIDRLNKLLDKARLSELHKEYIINELEKVFIECDYQHLQRKLKSLKEDNK